MVRQDGLDPEQGPNLSETRPIHVEVIYVLNLHQFIDQFTNMI